MAVFTEESARANVRNLDGRRVFYLAEGNHLTPSAREWLRKERIEVLPPPVEASNVYRTLRGATLSEKPEDMTHLRSGVLVEKEHPRIRFRGAVDTLEAQILLAGQMAFKKGKWEMMTCLRQLLDTARQIIRCEVLEENMELPVLGGLTEEELKKQSHHPEQYFDQPHFMPDFEDSSLLLQLNVLRTQIRETELLACGAFRDADGNLIRKDLILALNRMSSFVWILMIKLRKEERCGRQSG